VQEKIGVLKNVHDNKMATRDIPAMQAYKLQALKLGLTGGLTSDKNRASQFKGALALCIVDGKNESCASSLCGAASPSAGKAWQAAGRLCCGLCRGHSGVLFRNGTL
jgi:hypothetical protein